MRGFNEGKIMMHMDSRKEWESFKKKVLKESQLVGYDGLIISKIFELENKSKI